MTTAITTQTSTALDRLNGHLGQRAAALWAEIQSDDYGLDMEFVRFAVSEDVAKLLPSDVSEHLDVLDQLAETVQGQAGAYALGFVSALMLVAARA